jgi:hypothetical protein
LVSSAHSTGGDGSGSLVTNVEVAAEAGGTQVIKKIGFRGDVMDASLPTGIRTGDGR